MSEVHFLRRVSAPPAITRRNTLIAQAMHRSFVQRGLSERYPAEAWSNAIGAWFRLDQDNPGLKCHGRNPFPY